MTINRRVATLLIVVIILCAATLIIWEALKQEKAPAEAIVNETVVSSNSFSFHSTATDLKTSAEGTVFVKKDDHEGPRIMIVAAVQIDPEDWGGVAFYIPDQWTVSNITSSYPGNEPDYNPSDFIATWTTEAKDNANWSQWVEIGRNRNYKATGGGSGTVVIDLVPTPNESHSADSFEFGIELGSKEENGEMVMGTDTMKLPVSLTDSH